MVELNKGDIIEWTPQNGLLHDRLLTCTVVEILKVYNPVTLQPLNRVIIEFEVDGNKEQLALPEDAKYKVIPQE